MLFIENGFDALIDSGQTLTNGNLSLFLTFLIVKWSAKVRHRRVDGYVLLIFK